VSRRSEYHVYAQAWLFGVVGIPKGKGFLSVSAFFCCRATAANGRVSLFRAGSFQAIRHAARANALCQSGLREGRFICLVSFASSPHALLK
jgi:hypothetical protein